MQVSWELRVSDSTLYGGFNTTFVLDYDTVSGSWSVRYAQNALSAVVSCSPSVHPTVDPSPSSSSGPSGIPIGSPSEFPSSSPTAFPSTVPSLSPSSSPSELPSREPSSYPSGVPSLSPSSSPSANASCLPINLRQCDASGWSGASFYVWDHSGVLVYSHAVIPSNPHVYHIDYCTVESGLYSLTVQMP